MTRQAPYPLLLLAGAVVLLKSTVAVGQLSRARRAVRAPATPPPAKAEPSEPAKAEDTSPPAPTPQPVVTPPAVATPAPAVTPAPRATARPRPSPSPVTASAPSTGRLQQTRRRVRSAPPAATPAPQPTPPADPPPPANPPAPSRPPARPPHRHRPFGSDRQHVHHYHHTRPVIVPALTPPGCQQETVIINNVAPPPPAIFDQPLLVPQQAPEVDETIIPEIQPVTPPSEHSYMPAAESCHMQPSSCLTPGGCPTLSFLSFPYECGHLGVMSYGVQKNWAGSALFEYGSSFDGLDRRGFGLLLEHSSRLGIDFKWDSYIEDLGGGWTDELHLTDINVLCRVAESERYLIRAGLGANILGDAFGTDGGFNATAKVDLFPAQPLVLSGELDLGTIGDAELFHVSGKAGLMLDRFEIFGGYDYRTIGGVPLKGAMIGLQVWF